MENDTDAGGIGEPGLPAFAPALTESIFDLTGKRIRKLPFDQLACLVNCIYFPFIFDVFGRIGIEDDEISQFTFTDRTQICLHADYFCGVPCCYTYRL